METPLVVKLITQFSEGDLTVDFECGCFSFSDNETYHLNNIDCTEDPPHTDSLSR